ncbi:hypothetical protein [Terracidiphilus gabretensis]|uniref:hypothetical protein n=1 Tax=Terracidiphilus gabretensis TaxID=1577687 RepID=UPI00071B424D|nr:hypothetical protein [Terracidiphilus gabretensis]
MQYFLRAICFGAVILSAAGVIAQSPPHVQENAPATELPDAPQPQMAELELFQQQQPAPSNNGSQSSSQAGSQSGSGSQQPGQQPADQSQYDKAQQQLKKQESQRAFGIIPSFNTSFTQDVVPLTKGQKMKLAFRGSIDPFTFAQQALIGGYRELGDNYYGYGWGVQGYFKRAGSAYADSFLGNMIGNGFLPGIWHQEPRYFRLGHGNVVHRAFYAAISAVRCKHDGTDRWEPNYSNVIGNIIAGGISNLYYPREQKGLEHTFGDGLVNTATGIIGSEFQEFAWDIAKRFQKKTAQQIDEGQQANQQKKQDQQQ